MIKPGLGTNGFYPAHVNQVMVVAFRLFTVRYWPTGWANLFWSVLSLGNNWAPACQVARA
jgi:hypothetical protein